MKIFTLILLFSLNSTVLAASLSIQVNEKTKIYHSYPLLKSDDIEKVTLKNIPIYPNIEITYKAIKLATLLNDFKIPYEGHLALHALDGYVAHFPLKKLLNRKNATAYIAIEDPSNKWPNLKLKEGTAGPYFLIWKSHGKNNLNQEDWTYKISKIELSDSLDKLFSKIVPKVKMSNKAIWNGFAVFKHNCIVCHKINEQGHSDVGPDLNVPHSPTEYFKIAYLKKYIRSPKSLRKWKNSQMLNFPENELSNKDLNDLISYLEHMATTRKK